MKSLAISDWILNIAKAVHLFAHKEENKKIVKREDEKWEKSKMKFPTFNITIFGG